MICHNCQNEIPDDSRFCVHCGSAIQNVERPETAFDNASANQQTADVIVMEDEQTAEKESVPEAEQPIAKPARAKGGVIVPWILAGVLLLACVGVACWLMPRNAALKAENQALTDEATRLNATVKSLEEQVAQNDSQVAAIKAENDELNTQIDELTSHKANMSNQIRDLETQLSEYTDDIAAYQVIADHYEAVCGFFSDGRTNYASASFHANKSVVVMHVGDAAQTITLTANYANEFTVYFEVTGDAVSVEWQEDTFIKEVDSYVTAVASGVAAVTYTNNVNAEKVEVLIIVTP